MKKKTVRTVWIMRDNYDYLICPSRDYDADITIPVDRFENMFRVRLGNGNDPVEFRLERVIRKRGKFAKRPAKARRKKAK